MIVCYALAWLCGDAVFKLENKQFMQHVNWFAILWATIISVVVHTFWHRKNIFKPHPGDDAKNSILSSEPGQIALRFLVVFFICFVYASVLAKFMIMTAFTAAIDGLKLGFIIGLCFTSIGMALILHGHGDAVQRYIKDIVYLVTLSSLMGLIIGIVSQTAS